VPSGNITITLPGLVERGEGLGGGVVADKLLLGEGADVSDEPAQERHPKQGLARHKLEEPRHGDPRPHRVQGARVVAQEQEGAVSGQAVAALDLQAEHDEADHNADAPGDAIEDPLGPECAGGGEHGRVYTPAATRGRGHRARGSAAPAGYAREMADTPRRSAYHHGDLREALLDAAGAILREAGPEALTLREAARRVGVTHRALLPSLSKQRRAARRHGGEGLRRAPRRGARRSSPPRPAARKTACSPSPGSICATPSPTRPATP
jgi:hypothetical protein